MVFQWLKIYTFVLVRSFGLFFAHSQCLRTLVTYFFFSDAGFVRINLYVATWEGAVVISDPDPVQVCGKFTVVSVNRYK